jgi:hypothetical protein
MLKKLWIIFIILTSIKFFGIILFSDSIIIICEIIIFSFSAILLLLPSSNQKPTPLIQRNNSKGIFIILLSVLISFLGALLIKNQQISVSFIASRFMYFYILYFLFHKFKLESGVVEQFIIIIAICYSIFYFIALFQPGLFSLKIGDDLERELVRVYMPGILYVVLAFFIFLSRLVIGKNYFGVILIFFFIMTLFFTGSRMVAFPAVGIGFIYLFNNSKLLKKGYLIFPIFIGIIFFSLFNNVIVAMFSKILDDLYYDPSKGNFAIRVNAAYFFFNIAFPNYWGLIIGNGFASTHSEYGVFIDYLKVKLGFHQSDLGIIGDYTRFGILYLIGIVMILFKTIKFNYAVDWIYLKYFFVFIAFSMITLSHFGYSDGITAVCTSLYILDLKISEETKKHVA